MGNHCPLLTGLALLKERSIQVPFYWLQITSTPETLISHSRLTDMKPSLMLWKRERTPWLYRNTFHQKRSPRKAVRPFPIYANLLHQIAFVRAVQLQMESKVAESLMQTTMPPVCFKRFPLLSSPIPYADTFL